MDEYDGGRDTASPRLQQSRHSLRLYHRNRVTFHRPNVCLADYQRDRGLAGGWNKGACAQRVCPFLFLIPSRNVSGRSPALFAWFFGDSVNQVSHDGDVDYEHDDPDRGWMAADLVYLKGYQ